MTGKFNTDEKDYDQNHSELKTARIELRIGAYVIDHIIIILVITVPYLIFAFRNAQSDSAKILSMFPVQMYVAAVIYFLKDCVNGASIGKRVLGLTVRSTSDVTKVPSISKLVLRNIFTFIWPIELLFLICSSSKTKIGDKIAHTNVFQVDKKINVPAIIIAAILAVSTFVASLLFGISSSIKNDSSYQTALHYIEKNTEVSNLAGEIEGYGYWPNGNLTYGERGGRASYTIKVIGSENTIYVHVQLEKKSNQDWEIINFNLR